MQPEALPTIGVCIITNQTNTPVFAECLASITTADEVLIIDNNSATNWQPFTHAYKNLRVIEYPASITNFATVRSFGLQQMRSSWVLFLDSDEVLSQDGITELRSLAQPSLAGVMLRRHDVFHHKHLGFGEGGNKMLMRFVRAQAATVQGAVHETIAVDGAVSTARCSITHYAHTSISEFFESIAGYAQLASTQAPAGKLQNLLQLLFFPLGKFWYAVIIQGVWRDGWRGIVYATMMSLHSLFVRIYRYEKIFRK